LNADGCVSRTFRRVRKLLRGLELALRNYLRAAFPFRLRLPRNRTAAFAREVSTCFT